jgi:DNA mismatch endonuclease (patch repair protein)
MDATTAKRLSRVKQKDTPVEKALRSALHSQGHRFRKNARPLPGTRRSADILFPSSKVAVFIDGCFWHRCPVHGTSPKNNADWWQKKLDANVERDRETDRLLRSAGWLPSVFGNTWTSMSPRTRSLPPS